MRIAAFFLAWPLAELIALILAGSRFGFWPVVFWLAGAALAGAWLIRFGGRKAVLALQGAVRGGAMPAEVAGSAMTVAAGVLLIVPGLIGDAVALALLMPPVRRLLARRFAPAGVARWGVVWRSGAARDPHHARDRDTGVIDGQYEVIADGTADKPDHRP